MSEVTQNNSNSIRIMVRGAYDLQKMRIQMGNRVTTNFKSKLGLKQDGMSEKELDKQEKKILDTLRASYKRITDGVVKNAKDGAEGKLPTQRKFVGDEIISSYTELVLVDQYMSLLRNEEVNFYRLTGVLKGIPIYDEFLSEVAGVGPALAGIIISEIDIHKAEYPSSLWMYAGLDSVSVAFYMNGDKECHVPLAAVSDYYEMHGGTENMTYNGFPVVFKSVGRSRKEFCLVQREYTNKAGEIAYRNSITYNPFLKTKLIGVLGTSFLRSGTSTVDGKKMGAAKRLELAKSLGFDQTSVDADNVDGEVNKYLRLRGYDVVVEPCEYAKHYYNYKNRLENDPRHKTKSDGHRHNMAIRFMVKRFLVDLYSKWRGLEGLPVAQEYSAAKLGMVHGKAK